MQTPKLSGAQRAYMFDPEGFKTRMRHRAEELWLDGYKVEAGGETGLFFVTTPKGEQYRVNVLSEDCTCAYQQKAELPEIPCKHLQGIGGLIEEQLSCYKQHAEQHELADRLELASPYREAYRRLESAWREAADEAQCRQAEEETANAETATGCDAYARF